MVELGDAGRALPVGHAEAVGGGVAAADDHHVLAGGVDRRGVGCRPATTRLAGTRCSIARCTPRSAPARASPGCPGRPARRRPAAPRRARSRSSSAVTSTPTLHAGARTRTPSAAQLRQPRVDVLLLQLEVGDAVAQQAADRVVALVHGDRVPGAGELLRGGQPGRAGADHGDPPAGRLPAPAAARRSPRSNARLAISTSTCLMVTGSSPMPSTQAASHGAGHSRPVNSGKLLVACSDSAAAAHVAGADQVVPVRDAVAQRAAVVAERDAAVHAAGGLLADQLLAGAAGRPRASPHAHRHRAARGQLPLVAQEAVRVRHGATSMTASSTFAAGGLGGPDRLHAPACSRAAPRR